jgi:hypothetical protein
MENGQDEEIEGLSNSRGNINTVQGDVIGMNISGSHHNIGKYVYSASDSATININSQQLVSQIPKEYADSIKAFTDAINQQFKANNVQPEHVQTVGKDIEEFTKGLEGVKPGQEGNIGVIKRNDLKTKFINIAKNVLKVLPKTAAAVALFNPLSAPFSPIIGEATQYLVEGIQKEV